jgi:tRNA threonylcarbamoyladenosine biosynthesis protein TsaE
LTPDPKRDCWETGSPEETLALGEALGRSLFGGITIGLVGPLGAGKTQLVKGIAVGNRAGGQQQVTSPTFALIHEHAGEFLLYHIDAYRLQCAAELTALGFDELIHSGSAVVVEWGDRVGDALPPEAVWIEITPISKTTRRFSLRPGGPFTSRLLEAFHREYGPPIDTADAGT